MDSNEDRHWFKLAVPLAWLSGLDELPAANALPDAFGDRYLYRNNPVFRNVRDAVVGFGYRFSCEDTPLWRDYRAFPLTTLHRILAEKTIPYLNTGLTVNRLLADNPKAELSPGFLVGSLSANYTFHESAHCVAYGVIRRFNSELTAIAPDEKQRFVLEAVLAESFANTVEKLAAVEERAAISDTVFYVLNSHTERDVRMKPLLDAASAALSRAACFSALFLASFEANLTGEPPADAVYRRIAGAVDGGDHHLSALKSVTDLGFGLSAAFRENTNPMYFALLGYKAEYRALTQAAWLCDPDHRAFARQLAAALFAIAQ